MATPWEEHQAEAHRMAVASIKNAQTDALDAEGWISILPGIPEHTFKLLASIVTNLDAVQRAIDRPTVLEDYDNGVAAGIIEAMEEVANDPLSDPTLSERIAEARKETDEPKVYKFDATGDIE